MWLDRALLIACHQLPRILSDYLGGTVRRTTLDVNVVDNKAVILAD